MHKKKKLPTVTIAISAYNEVENIRKFLRSVVKQSEAGYVLKEIIVISDGSTDRTSEIVKQFPDKRVTLFTFKNRIGKSSHLNFIYKMFKTDYLIQSDSDIVMKGNLVIAELIKVLENNKRIGMCGGNPIPLKPKTLTEKAINCTVEAYLELRKLVRDGNNIFSADGRLLAFRKAFIKEVHVPSDMIANDAFVYFCCITRCWKYAFVPEAVVLFRSPKNVQDQIRQNTRFRAAPLRFKKMFPKNIVDTEYHIPMYLLLYVYAKQFLKSPFLCLYIYIINLYCKVRALSVESRLHARWDIAITTKRLSL
ncbi:MAG: glycosyltransferase [Candidatus Levybacteria bacterium]|nr:glycosyltransferase [Candidatus Levybacteria bacterium]